MEGGFEGGRGDGMGFGRGPSSVTERFGGKPVSAHVFDA
jgi:hypothetical protein